MTEFPTTVISDLSMVHFASQRAVVRLTNGRTARLIRWRGQEGPNNARVEFPSGRAATVRLNEVEAWFDVLVEQVMADLGESPEAWRGAAVMIRNVAALGRLFEDHPGAAVAAMVGMISKLIDLPPMAAHFEEFRS
ncbi:MAG TPA: hypothetical protein VIX41_11155 [Acidimicrobiales bacterium]